MSACSTSLALATGLRRRAGRLARAAGRRRAVRSLSNFVGSLPPLGPSGGGARLTQAQVEAFAGLYYYGELETSRLMSVAEIVVEERYTLNLNDRKLFQALEEMADAMDRGWYDGERRAQIFSASLGFDTQDDFRRTLGNVAEALERYDEQSRYGGVSLAPVATVEFAMGAALDQVGRRGRLGLERASQILNSQLRKAIAILGNASLQRLFGARNLWGLVGAIVVDANGLAPDFTTIADRAEAGAGMLGWIAGRINEIRSRDGSIAAHLRNDASLFRHANRWRLAAANLSGVRSPDYGGDGQGAYGGGSSPWHRGRGGQVPWGGGGGGSGGNGGGWA